MNFGLVGLYLKTMLLEGGLLPRKGVLVDKGGWEPRQSDSNILCCPGKPFLTYARKTDVKASSLQKLETWLIHMVKNTNFRIKLPEYESWLPTVYRPCDIGHIL